MDKAIYKERFKMTDDQIRGFCQRYHIKRLSLFGSILREDFRPDSDIDVLVEFSAHATVSLFFLMRGKAELEATLNRPIDLRTPLDLSHFFRGEVMQSAMVLYAE